VSTITALLDALEILRTIDRGGDHPDRFTVARLSVFAV